jgi:hypothetical protein
MSTIKNLDLQQTADYLEAADIERSHNSGAFITHIGTNLAGNRFVLVNGYSGETYLIEE